MAHSRKSNQAAQSKIPRRKFVTVGALTGVSAGVAFAERSAHAASKSGSDKRYGMVIDLRRSLLPIATLIERTQNVRTSRS